MLIPFENDHVALNIEYLFNNKSVQIAGAVKLPKKFVKMVMIAAAPIDRMANYSGSGLPFPCRQFAFENTPNYHEIGVDGNIVRIFEYPNSYYDQACFNKLPPAVEIHLYTAITTDPLVMKIDLPDYLPLKTLVHRPGRSPVFYARQENMEITGQETYLRNIAAAKVNYPTA